MTDNFESALIGRAQVNCELVDVYAEHLILDVLRSRLATEHPDYSKDELDADAADLLSDFQNTCSYMHPSPIIVELN